MPTNIADILNTIAIKLGIASEALWAVLVKQAIVSIVIDIFQCIICLVTLFYSLNFVILKTKKKLCKSKYGEEFIAEWDGEGAFFAWAGVITFACVVFFIILFNIESIVTALVNPEYWAFQKLTSLLKVK
jgi:hypothetical protein